MLNENFNKLVEKLKSIGIKYVKLIEDIII